MYEYRRVLVRMRRGASDREIARQGLMGRKTARKLRRVAQEEGWLEEATVKLIPNMARSAHE